MRSYQIIFPLLKKGITPSFPDFNDLMYAIVKKMNEYTSKKQTQVLSESTPYLCMQIQKAVT
jgi:hypothetical protein